MLRFGHGRVTAGAQARLGLHVLKDPDCGCCSAWVEILQSDGFDVTVEESGGAALAQYKLDKGIPQSMGSCHTGRIAGYMIEGHVPPADIRRLLDERPDAIGLTVPGMPYGSPGMGPESGREAYEVFLIRRDGTADVFPATRLPRCELSTGCPFGVDQGDWSYHTSSLQEFPE